MGEKHPLKLMVRMKQFRLFSIAMLFVLLITCFVNFYFYNLNVHEQERRREQRVEDLAAVYRDQFSTMGLLIRQLNNSRMVDDLRYNPSTDADSMKKYQALIHALELIEGSYSGDVRPFVFFHDTNSIVTSSGKMQADLLEQEFGLDGELDLDALRGESSSEIQIFPKIGIYHSTTYALRQQANWGALYLYTRDGVSVMAVTRNATLDEMLSVATQGADCLFAIWDRQSGKAVMSNCEAIFGETFVDADALSDALRAQDDRGVLTMRERGRFTYFTLDNASPDDIIGLRTNVFMWVTVTLGLSFVMLYYLLLRREVFRPLASIIEKLSCGGPPSNEYAAIEDAIFNMQNRIQNLSEALQSAEQHEREGLLRRMMFGVDNQSASIMPSNGGYFAVATLIGEKLSDTEDVAALIQTRFAGQRIANIEEQSVYLVWFETRDAYEDFLSAVVLDGVYVLGISALHEDPTRIRQAYLESCDVLHACSQDAARRPVIYVAGRDAKDVSVSTPMNVNESGMLLSTIANGDEEAAAQFVAEILDVQQPRTIAQSRYVATYMLNILSMAQNTAKENVFDLTMLTSRVYRMVDAEAMRRLVVEACRALTHLFSDSKEDALIRTIRDFVEKHYAENIYLKTVVEETGLSYAYVSHYFSERQGIGFTDYLNSVRVEKACAMLKQWKIPLNEIAERVGFGSMNTFVRNMKKFTGMTPDAYRKASAREAEPRENSTT